MTGVMSPCRAEGNVPASALSPLPTSSQTHKAVRIALAPHTVISPNIPCTLPQGTPHKATPTALRQGLLSPSQKPARDLMSPLDAKAPREEVPKVKREKLGDAGGGGGSGRLDAARKERRRKSDVPKRRFGATQSEGAPARFATMQEEVPKVRKTKEKTATPTRRHTDPVAKPAGGGGGGGGGTPRRTSSPKQREASPRPSPRRYTCPVAPSSPAASTVIRELHMSTPVKGAGKPYSTASIRIGTPDAAAASLRETLRKPQAPAGTASLGVIGRTISVNERAQLEVYRMRILQKKLHASRTEHTQSLVAQLRQLQADCMPTILEGGRAGVECTQMSCAHAMQQAAEADAFVASANQVMQQTRAVHEKISRFVKTQSKSTAVLGATGAAGILSAAKGMLDATVEGGMSVSGVGSTTHVAALTQGILSEASRLRQLSSELNTLMNESGSHQVQLLQAQTARARLGL